MKRILVVDDDAFLTADATENTVMTAGKLGADGYIKKPYMPQNFLERVENVLGNK